ncbi:MAG: hypothetical protein Q9169_007466 [Polycauliona sp. 2 TL-2023]
MPNKYSHALVLSRYETKGFINLPPRAPSPPPSASFSSSNLDVYATNGRNSVDIPSLNAVPTLSDSSTTSTASTSSEPSKQPSHSASSSIVTEIYAPQALSVESIPTTDLPVKQDPPEVQPPTPSPIREPSPPPKKSRFSSFHDLSPFISRHSSPARRSKKSSRRHSYQPAPQSSKSTPPASRPLSPIFKTTHEPRQPVTTMPHAQPSHQQTIYHKRLEPFFSDDSLDSLSLEDIQSEDEGRKSPNMDVLPWEYPETYSSSPSTQEPHNRPDTKTQPTTSSTNPSQTSIPQNPSNNTDNHSKTSLPTTSAMHFNSLNQPIKYFPPPSPSTHSQSHSLHHSSPQAHHASPPPAPAIRVADHPPIKIKHTRNLLRPLSTESFDSAAPPPIRTTPRVRQGPSTLSR